jgi:hypothetical protein
MKQHWELQISHELPSTVEQLGCLAVGDVDGDGQIEVVTGGEGALLWYRPGAFESGVIAEGHFHVGLALEDLTGDGRLEVVAGRINPSSRTWTIVWFKAGADLFQPWQCHIIDPACNGGSHDLIFVDLDGDGELELLANAAYCAIPGIFAYKRDGDPTRPWRKHELASRRFLEGLAADDLDGDGRVELIHGPDWFSPPADGPYSGPWEQKVYAPAFREMCRTALVDITSNGRPDVVIAESEYLEGRMSWFENRLVEDPENPWIEHEMERGLVYAHSLSAWREQETGVACVFVAEMAQGGWNPPYNWDARLIQYASSDQGQTWQREIVYEGAGTHQAVAYDLDGDGEVEYVGKECWRPRIQIWKRRKDRSRLTRFRHRLLDRDKANTATDILAADVDGDGLLDVVCGSWWYKNPTWERHDIPGVAQVINAFDLDGDGRQELIATKGRMKVSAWYESLNSELCWLKPVNGASGWECYSIGTGVGDWPHGNAIAPLLPGGRLALITAYHSAHASASHGHTHFPEIFEVPDDPTQTPWPKRTLAEIVYGEEIVPFDLTGDGNLDLVAGCWWLENLGDGDFEPYRIVDDFYPARLGVADINGNGRPDVVLGEEVLDFENQVAPFSRLAWFENPSDPRQGSWKMHIIDTVRCPHSVAAADIDGDGEVEIICGEHDPFWPYRSRCRLLVYKKANPEGTAWYRYTLDDRFEHHDGTKIFESSPGKPGIISHGWKDSIYVHLWEAY